MKCALSSLLRDVGGPVVVDKLGKAVIRVVSSDVSVEPIELVNEGEGQHALLDDAKAQATSHYG